MKYIKLFENFNSDAEKKIKDALYRLEDSINACPSTRGLTKLKNDIMNIYHVFKLEKAVEIKQKLLSLQKEIDKCYDISDEKYLQKDERGTKYAPGSAIKIVLGYLSNVESPNEEDDTEYDSFDGTPLAKKG